MHECVAACHWKMQGILRAKRFYSTAELIGLYQAHILSYIEYICFGGWLPEGEKNVQELAVNSAGRTGRDYGIVLMQFWQRLSIALWRGNARQILHCLA